MFRAAIPCLLSAILLPSGCGGATSEVDYAELLVVGVEPAAEADRVIAYLEPAGLLISERVEVGPVIALGFRRERDDHRAIRVVTPRGVTLALDSHAEDGVEVRDGPIEIDAARSGGDLDGDGRPEVVVARREELRRCLLLLEVDPDGEVRPLVVDARDLAGDVCLEDLRDVNGDGTIEAIVGLRAPSLTRTVVPHAELPLERDEAGVYRRAPPAVAFMAAAGARLDASLAAARAAGDPELCYALAVERALFELAAGRAVEAQLSAFDSAIASTVWPDEFSEVLLRAREAIAAGRW